MKLQVLNDEMFTVLVLMALFTTFMTTPSVLAVYKPAQRNACRSHRRHLKLESCHSDESLSSTSRPQDDDEELRILCCVHGPVNVPSMVNLIELTRGPRKFPLKLYSVHLVELTDRSSSIMMVQRARKNGFPFISHFARGREHGQVSTAFEAYAEVSRVKVRPTTAISALHIMHEDVCHVAKRKRATVIILRFHKQWRGYMEDEMQYLGHGWRVVNQRVLKDAPCTVPLLVDRGFGGGKYCLQNEYDLYRVCVLLLGGPDDREALELAGRIKILSFLPKWCS